jgi:hypothetical protein
MKKLLALSLIAAIFMSGCDDDDPAPTPPASNFQPTTTNSTWTYKFENKNNAAANYNFTVKAINKDTSINSKTYKVFTSTAGGNEYYLKSGTDYYQFAGFAGLTNSIELNYLKDAAVGTKWSETKAVTINGFPVSPTFNYEIKEKLSNLTVNALNFTNVLRVQVTLTVPGLTITSQDLNFFYADGVGRVKTQTKLVVSFPVINADTETSITAYTIAP